MAEEKTQLFMYAYRYQRQQKMERQAAESNGLISGEPLKLYATTANMDVWQKKAHTLSIKL